MASVVALSCPVCAAPLQPESSRCDYCRSVVVIKTDLPRIDPHLLNQSVINEHIGQFRARVRRDPHDAEAHYGLGVAYLNLGLVQEAADALARASAEMPEAPSIQHQLAVVYERLASSGRGGASARASARDRAERALLLRPRFVDALLLKAKLLDVEGDAASAVQTLREVAAIDADAAQAPLKSFLARHEADLRTLPRYSSEAAKAQYAAAIQPRRDSAKRLAWAAAIFAVFLVGADVPVLVAILLPVAVLVYRWKKLSLEPANLRTEWERRDANRTQLVSPSVSPVADLLEAAAAVGHAGPAARAVSAAVPAVSPPVVAANANRAPIAWETCEILAQQVTFKGKVFSVQVEGPRGKYRLRGYGEDRGFPNRKRGEDHVRWLHMRLAAEGWEPYGKGRNWWNYKFRRPARS